MSTAEKYFLRCIPRISEEYWRDLPKIKASVLVANELGFSDVSGDSVKVSDITDENKTVNFIARIVSAFEVKEFTRSDGSIGRVGNLIVGDETGKIRVTLWDNIADLLKTGEIKVARQSRSVDMLNMVIPG